MIKMKIQKQVLSTIWRTFQPHVQVRTFVSKTDIGESLKPFVHPKLSYTYGRSTSYLLYKTVGQCLQEVAEELPDKVAVIFEHQNICKTYSQLNSDVNQLSKAMINDLGLKHGDVAGCWSANVYEFVVVQYALARIGAINCSISPVFKSNELEYVLSKGGLKTMFMPDSKSIQNKSINNFHEVLSKIDHSRTVLEDVVFVESNAPSIKNDKSSFGFNVNTHGINYLMNKYDSSSLSDDILSQVDPDDTCNIFFTSGTTGKPKGAASSHQTMINNTFLSIGCRRGINIRDNQRVIACPLPMFHGFVGMTGVYSLSTVPMTLVIPNYKYSPQDMVKVIKKYQCSDAWCVPTILLDILNYAKNHPDTDLTSLREIVAAAAPVPAELTRAARKQIPNLKRVIVAYGSTETGPVVTYPMKDDSVEISGETVGCALDFVEVKVVEPTSGAIVGHGETGELLTRGHNIMQGYWKEPEKTAEVLKHGWYHTGDMATMDSNGYFKIVGRMKELIIRGGANVYPREVEDLLLSHPSVLTAAVCGVPHPKLGEAVCAWVKLRDGQVATAEEIRTFCKDKISYYKVPEHVLFVDGFPMTASGKVQKFAMTQESIKLLNLEVKVQAG